MTETTDPDALAILACDLEARPPGASGLDAIAGSIVSVAREGRALVVSFAAAAARDVEAFAAAERQCCASLAWNVEAHQDVVRLTVGASPEQLDVLEQLFGGHGQASA